MVTGRCPRGVISRLDVSIIDPETRKDHASEALAHACKGLAPANLPSGSTTRSVTRRTARLMNRRKQFRAVATDSTCSLSATVRIADIFIWLRAKTDRRLN
jgi:hypothetical protein